MIILALVCIILLAGVDQLIKVWIIDNLKGAESIEFIKLGNIKVIDLTYLENDGAVFGSFSGQRIMLIAVSIIMVLVCGYYLFKYGKTSKLFTMCLILIISGGIGNGIDRIFRGGRVVDYIEVKLFNFAIFNFADICVVIGVILLAIYIFFIDSKTNCIFVDKKHTTMEENQN
ncbi:MAG: signal peptidase II [Ruminococcus sp.]|nr:signal peptidase II [Ruminococcus sp.]